ncbi:ectoine hydrolase DoeA [Roseospira marina]|uniref:Ectoine hydrolase DoeA n=1 Tax=Roseospira marina TaxID=140057 RepID=A0A5M6I7J2_9PROT|nr:ectoine hydrolase DoeA [Roseospira marina]KAA5604103.1 ectoine hydrolase DoeA [Roseospira marina]MBB4315797.1 ectoine hydrolase [Roseospira marina]MBB5088964.1 ectoine hydrolase [Roseospira marina]
MSYAKDLRFAPEEYARRVAKAKTAMAAAGIDLLIVTDPSNMNWLTGYDGWSFYVHQAVVLPVDDDPLWWGRGQDGNGARMTSWLAEDRIHPYADHFVQSTERHPMQDLARVLRERGWDAKRTGVEMDNYYFSAKAYQTLVAELPNARFQDATALVNWQRAVKSEPELVYMRRAARIVDAMHARIRDVVAPGMRKSDLVAEIYDAGLRGTADFGGDYAAIVPLVASGVEASAPHLTWTDKPLQSGEGTFFEVAGCYHHYHCPLSRTVFLGQPTQTFLDAEKAVLEGMEAGLEKARAGNTCEDVAAAFFGVLRTHGIEKDNRTGYPIGVSYPPDWGERTMSFRMGDRTVLEPNMTFHFMTGLWMDDWGFEITESLVIRDGAPEILANTPRELVVKA